MLVSSVRVLFLAVSISLAAGITSGLRVLMRATVIGLARYPGLRKVGSVEFREQATIRSIARFPVTMRCDDVDHGEGG